MSWKKLLRSRRGQSSAIGIIFMILVFSMIINVMFESNRASLELSTQDAERASERVGISYLLFGGVKSNYPISTTPTGSGSPSNLQAIDQNYVNFTSTQGYLQEFPIKNMNFTSDEDGWYFYKTSGAIGVIAGFVQSEGRLSPGSGQGSVYASLQGSSLGPYWLNWTYYFTYSSGTLESAYFSWGWKADIWTAMQTSTIYVTLNGPSPSLPITIRTVVVAAQGAWTFEGNLPISASAFNTPGNYWLNIALRAQTNPSGNIRMLFDDVGIVLNVKSGWLTDWYGTYNLAESSGNLEKLKLQYTGHYSPTASYNPSTYNLLASTKHVAGSVADLQSNDGAYMEFRSYVSASSTTLKTDAFISYRDSVDGLSIPKERTWTGDTAAWASQSKMPTAGSTVRFVRVAYSPIEERSYEKIVVTLSDDGYLDAYVYDGTSWAVTNNIGFPGITANVYKCFDVAYEKTTGRALLVYSRGVATTNEIGYRIWTFGTGWGAEQLLDPTYTSGIVRFISLASAPGTRLDAGDDNEIALIYLDANTDVHGYVWTGLSWNQMGVLAVWDATAAIATEECIAVAYEQASGRAMFIWGDATSTDNYNRIWNGATLSGPTLAPDITTQGAVTNWVTLKSNPLSTSNELMYLVVDGALDLNTAYWSGSAWTVHTTDHDADVDTHAQRPADFAWEPTGSKGLLVWGTLAGSISYKTFTAPSTFVGPTVVNIAGSGTHPWVQLRTNPRSITGIEDVRILGAILDGTLFDIGAISWDGTTFTVIGSSSNAISSDVTTLGVTYECFEIEFMNFGPPTQFTTDVEFTGSSNIKSWTQLEWTIDSSFTTAGVTAIYQLYNYQTGYPTSGDGYMTDTIGTTDVTKSQLITTNPTNYRDASGNWRIKVSGVKAGSTQFDFKVDWIEYKPTWIAAISVSQTMYLWDHRANQWHKLSTIAVGTGDMRQGPFELTESLGRYVNQTGGVKVRILGESNDLMSCYANNLLLEDYFKDRTRLTVEVKNEGALKVDLVSIWIINSTYCERIALNTVITLAPGETYTKNVTGSYGYLSPVDYKIKVVTLRGSITTLVVPYTD